LAYWVSSRREHSVSDFPFLSPTLDQVEHLTGSWLVCWAHSLRDVLYSCGFTDTARALVQPLDFEIQWDAAGLPEAINGGGQIYPGQQFHRGLRVSWASFTEPRTALEHIQAELAAGRAVPVWPVVTALPHSLWYKTPLSVLPHTVVIFKVDTRTEQVGIADTHARPNTGFADNRGEIGLADLTEALRGCVVCDWSLEPDPRPWSEELTWVLEETLHGNEERQWARGILELEAMLRNLSTHVGRQVYLRHRVLVALRHVAGQRRLLARALQVTKDVGPAIADAARAVERAGDAWTRFCRTILLYSQSSQSDVPAVARKRIEEVHAAEEAALVALPAAIGALSRHSRSPAPVSAPRKGRQGGDASVALPYQPHKQEEIDVVR
jgi:hypothetical protein